MLEQRLNTTESYLNKDFNSRKERKHFTFKKDVNEALKSRNRVETFKFIDNKASESTSKRPFMVKVTVLDFFDKQKMSLKKQTTYNLENQGQNNFPDISNKKFHNQNKKLKRVININDLDYENNKENIENNEENDNNCLELSFGNRNNTIEDLKLSEQEKKFNFKKHNTLNSGKKKSKPNTDNRNKKLKESYNYSNRVCLTNNEENNATNQNIDINQKLSFPSKKAEFKKYFKIQTYSQNSKHIRNKTLFKKDIKHYLKELSRSREALPKYHKVKCSQNEIGSYIKSFAVNSYTGFYEKTNKNKVAIVLKVSQPKNFNGYWPEISYLAIFEGLNGTKCSDFLRDNLHQYIVKNKNFPNNPKQALIEGFEEADKKYTQAQEVTNLDGSYALVALIIDNTLYAASVGNSRMIISLNNGNELKVMNNYMKKTIKSFGNMSTLPLVQSVKENINTKIEVDVNSFDLSNDKIDFIVMGSRGLFEKMNENDVLNSAFHFFNKYNYKDFHLLSGAIVDYLISQALKKESKENITCILLGFHNFFEKFKNKKMLKINDSVLKINRENRSLSKERSKFSFKNI